MEELLEAAKNNDLEKVKFLIDKGADVNAKDYFDMTALMYAVDDYDITKLLIDSGADVNLIDINGKTALIYASQKGHLEVAEFLKANGAV